MASKKKEAESAVYERNELVRQARTLFGVAPEAAIGALSGTEGKLLTLEVAKDLITQFMNRKVSG